MKNIKSICTAFLAGLGMMTLILDTPTAVSSAREGLALCAGTIIPSMFPFFVLSSLLTGSISHFRTGFLRPIGKLCRLPKGSEPLLLLGLLGGYPAGAQNVAHYHSLGGLSTQDARRLLGFCSNAGPAFLFGIVGTQFPQKWMPWALWGIHITSAILTGILLSGKAHSHTQTASGTSVSLPMALDTGLRTIARVCGWIILFRILMGFLDKWFLFSLSDTTKTLISGILELSIGCCSLRNVSDIGLRFVICSVLLSVGGLSVLMQTVSVTGKLGLGAYLPGKLLQALLSFQFSYQVQYFLLPLEQRLTLPASLIFFIWFCLFILKIAVAIRRTMMYNSGILRKLRSRLCFSVKKCPKPATTAPMEPAMKRV